MVAVLENPEIRALVKPYSVEDYHRLFELGIIGEKFELIRGAVIEKMPQSPSHASIIALAREHLQEVLPRNTYVREEKPLTLSDSEPEPDLALVRGSSRDYRTSHPDSALLVIEVSISSESLDRVKLELYAEAGVSETWLIIPEKMAVERYSDPRHGCYQQTASVIAPAALESTVVVGFSLPTEDLFVD